MEEDPNSAEPLSKNDIYRYACLASGADRCIFGVQAVLVHEMNLFAKFDYGYLLYIAERVMQAMCYTRQLSLCGMERSFRCTSKQIHSINPKVSLAMDPP